ncbi:MAG: ATP synthase F1 subunit gamma [Firmicutes bacterium]|nr:ATP synthase F1 subunit gamma [Bacillota bacterium]MBQ6608769.1 ATP synthase F1 subunit gamma [Bacillota bacterium]MBR3261074.1 ATP synthase F1 subunit gamma [Bacillota bacterium]MBR3376049.1 ATP synthase F1 subunit gamma [Bacillota bacterium]MBR6225504.1 ATP synthase F1 subunit gamma [Bacillota bacterium]
MATTKEIKNRIKSVKDTQKITNAMYLISSTKMTKAKKELDNTRPYFEMLKKQIITMIQMTESADNYYFQDRSVAGEEPLPPGSEEKETVAYLVITADKGLAGAYNQNVIKEAMRLIKGTPSYKLFVVGEYGRRYFEARGMSIDQSFLYTAQNPTLERAREITQVLTGLYSKGQITKVYIVYTDFRNGLMGGDVVSSELLPFDREDFQISAEEAEQLKGSFVEYMPSVSAVLNNVIPSYLSGYIYSALVDSFCSEQSARMSAMDAANQNAEELLDRLNLEYNHVRQGAITQEITEVSAGSRGQKKSKKKREEREEGLN